MLCSGRTKPLLEGTLQIGKVAGDVRGALAHSAPLKLLLHPHAISVIHRLLHYHSLPLPPLHSTLCLHTPCTRWPPPNACRPGPKTVAVRVCTDCHFSLKTVTVASIIGLDETLSAVDANNGGGGLNGDADDEMIRRAGAGDNGRPGRPPSSWYTESGFISATWIAVRKGMRFTAERVEGKHGLSEFGCWRPVAVGRQGERGSATGVEEIAGDVVIADAWAWRRIKASADACSRSHTAVARVSEVRGHRVIGVDIAFAFGASLLLSGEAGPVGLRGLVQVYCS